MKVTVDVVAAPMALHGGDSSQNGYVKRYFPLSGTGNKNREEGDVAGVGSSSEYSKLVVEKTMRRKESERENEREREWKASQAQLTSPRRLNGLLLSTTTRSTSATTAPAANIYHTSFSDEEQDSNENILLETNKNEAISVIAESPSTAIVTAATPSLHPQREMQSALRPTSLCSTGTGAASSSSRNRREHARSRSRPARDDDDDQDDVEPIYGRTSQPLNGAHDFGLSLGGPVSAVDAVALLARQKRRWKRTYVLMPRDVSYIIFLVRIHVCIGLVYLTVSHKSTRPN